MILMFITSVLFLLPALGDALAAADVTALGRMLTLADDVGNVGTGVYGMVEDPKSAVFSSLG
jgi:chitinase